MRKSENFDLNLYEGTDIFNPLTTDVPNYEKIDAQMKKNYNLSVGKATELKTGTVHAITRENADCPMIHFTATSNYTSNDTFTVDGVQVSALLVDGSTLPTNCYIIGSEVICYLKGTLLTFFLSGSISKDSEKLGGELPSYYSKQEDFEQLETTVNSMNVIVEKNSNDIVDLNNNRKWKTLANSVPSTTQTEWTLPSDDWDELEVRIGYASDNNYCELRILKNEIPTTDTQFRRGGYYFDSQNRMYVGIGFTRTKIGISDFNYISGGISRNNYSTSIYYR